MAKKDLENGIQNWVDIANKKDGSDLRSVEEVVEKKEKNYPKCVPIAKARR